MTLPGRTAPTRRAPKQARVAGPARPPKPPRAPRPPLTGTPAVTSSAATMLAVVCLWVFVQLLLLGDLEHERAQDLLYGQFRTEVASATAPVGPVVPVGDPVALVRIPALDLEEVVVEGTASGDLRVGPGHQRNTVLPGQEGTSVLMGRAATYGRPFAGLTGLEPGDTIEVVVAQGTRTFTVLGVRRTGDPLPQPREAGVARLVLATAEGQGRLAGLTPGEAVYFDAEADDAFPAPAGRPAAIPESEQLMASEASVLPLLATCLAALVLATLLVISARQRWSAVLVWLLASPVVIALAWVTTDVLVRLLPNVM
ncbi:sortase domain-bontaining protein [Nocardioides marinus]|nr:sortase [Nocardioides marinus]